MYSALDRGVGLPLEFRRYKADEGYEQNNNIFIVALNLSKGIEVEILKLIPFAGSNPAHSNIN